MKVLIVRLSAIGDVIHTLPALELLRAELPEAELTWVVEAQAAPLLGDHPALDRVVVLDRRSLLRPRGRARALRGALAGLGTLRRESFDAVIDFQGLLRSALVARVARGPTFGPAWAREGARFLYQYGLEVPRPPEAHAVERACLIARETLFALGITARPTAPTLRLPAAFQAPVAHPNRLVVLPGAGKAVNRMPPTLLARVADLCAERRPNLDVVVAGGPGDVGRGADVVAGCARAQARSTCGELDLPGTGRLLASAAAVVGGDTGPLHLARALGRPVLGLFPAAAPFRTGPAGLPGEAPTRVLPGEVPCAPCCASRCQRPERDRICLIPFTAERVASELSALLDVAR